MTAPSLYNFPSLQLSDLSVSFSSKIFIFSSISCKSLWPEGPLFPRTFLVNKYFIIVVSVGEKKCHIF